MRIAVNTRLLLAGQLEGIGWFTYETLKRITTKHREHQFVFIFDRPFDERFIFSNNIIPVITPPQARHPFLYYLWFECSVPRVLKKHQADLFLSPDGYNSLTAKIPTLPVIHDLNFEHYPEDLPYLHRAYYRKFFPKYARKATRIATVSEFSKQDIVEQYHVAADKIDVVYNGANAIFQPVDEATKSAMRKELTHGAPYFVFIGSLHPRKNLANILRAFDLFREQADTDVRFVVIGQKKWWTSETETTFNQMKHKHDVLFLGRLSGERLNQVIGSALAMVYISKFEGFGIPILESFYAEIPVITSNVTSMPEVAGDAALLADPLSVDSITQAFHKITSDPTLAQALVESGRNRRAQFTWNKTADRLWASVEHAMEINDYPY